MAILRVWARAPQTFTPDIYTCNRQDLESTNALMRGSRVPCSAGDDAAARTPETFTPANVSKWIKPMLRGGQVCALWCRR